VEPHFIDLGTSWRWVVSFTSRPLYPLEKGPWYPLDKRLGGPQGQSGWFGEEKILDPTRTRTPTSVVQPVVSRYTDCAIPAPYKVLRQTDIKEYILNTKWIYFASRYGDVLLAGQPVFYSRRDSIFLSSIMSRSASGPTQTPIELVLGTISPGHEANYSQLVPRSRTMEPHFQFLICFRDTVFNSLSTGITSHFTEKQWSPRHKQNVPEEKEVKFKVISLKSD
jgi:hypothetical protein